MGAMKVWDGTTWQTVAPFSERASVFVGPDQPAGATYAGDLWWDTDDPATAYPGQELAYNQITASVTLAATSAAAQTLVIPGTTVAYDGSPVFIEIYSPRVDTPANAQSYLHICDGGNSLGHAGLVLDAAGTSGDTLFARRRYTPTAGTHTFNLYGYSGNGTGVLQAGPGNANNVFAPAFIRVTRV